MDKTLLKVSEKSIQEFLEAHGNFMGGISWWLMNRAEAGDAAALNHFTELIKIFFTEACKKLSEHDKGQTYQ